MSDDGPDDENLDVFQIFVYFHNSIKIYIALFVTVAFGLIRIYHIYILGVPYKNYVSCVAESLDANVCSLWPNEAH